MTPSPYYWFPYAFALLVSRVVIWLANRGYAAVERLSLVHGAQRGDHSPPNRGADGVRAEHGIWKQLDPYLERSDRSRFSPVPRAGSAAVCISPRVLCAPVLNRWVAWRCPVRVGEGFTWKNRKEEWVLAS